MLMTNNHFHKNMKLTSERCIFEFQLVPLLVALGAGAGMAALYTMRLATQNPDVS